MINTEIRINHFTLEKVSFNLKSEANLIVPLDLIKFDDKNNLLIFHSLKNAYVLTHDRNAEKMFKYKDYLNTLNNLKIIRE